MTELSEVICPTHKTRMVKHGALLVCRKCADEANQRKHAGEPGHGDDNALVLQAAARMTP